MVIAAQHLKLTKAAIESLPYVPPGEPAYIVRDAVLRNFFLKVGTRTKTFACQKDIRDADGKRLTVRRSLGHWGTDGVGVTVEAARQGAIRALAEINASNGQAAPQGGMTLAEAVDLFKTSNAKGRRGQPRAEKTQQRYGQFVTGRYLAAWMDRPLRSITRKEVYNQHQALTKAVAAGDYAGAKKGRNVPERQSGKTTADDVMRWFRAVYNRAMRADETLPVCPTINVEWWNVKAERTAIPSTKLAEWHAGVEKIANPVRRDYLLFVLFTGLRRESAATVRWEDVDWASKTLQIPKPKGGEERAFDLPLSDYLIALLMARRDENPKLAEQQLIPADSLKWVFPAYGASGHIAEPRTEIPGVAYTIHDLRRTFVTVAESLDISSYVIGALVNHRQPSGSVTAGYVAHEVERLREPMQKITDRLRALVSS